jgi:hypothetical protein
MELFRRGEQMSRVFIVSFIVLTLSVALNYQISASDGVDSPEQIFTVEPIVIQPSTVIPLVVTLIPTQSLSIPSSVQSTVPSPYPTFTPAPESRVVDSQSYWHRYESIELTQYQGTWQLFQTTTASDGGFHRSSDIGAVMRLVFVGGGFRVGYRLIGGGGDLYFALDGQSQEVVPTLLQSGEERTQIGNPIYFPSGTHTLDVITGGIQGQRFEIDFVDVYVGPEMANAANVSSVTATPNENGRSPLVSFDLVTMPQQVPTSEPAREIVISVDVVAFYDKNANGTADANEGIQNLSVRVLDQVSNRVVASSLTDVSGFAHIQVISSHDLLLVIPLLGRSREISVSRGGRRESFLQDQWLVLVEPINIPALIP